MKNLLYREFSESEARMLNPLQLALIEDGVYEVFIRSYILSENASLSAHKIHVKAVQYVKAKAQSDIINVLEDELKEDELYIYKGGRNAKSATMPKDTNARGYRNATEFEASVGYLCLTGEEERLNEFLSKCTEIHV